MLSRILLEFYPHSCLFLSSWLYSRGGGAHNIFCKNFLLAGYELNLGPTLLECSFINLCFFLLLLLKSIQLGYQQRFWLPQWMHNTVVPRRHSVV